MSWCVCLCVFVLCIGSKSSGRPSLLLLNKLTIFHIIACFCFFSPMSHVNIRPLKSSLKPRPCVVHDWFICSKQRQYPGIICNEDQVIFISSFKADLWPYLYTLQLCLIVKYNSHLHETHIWSEEVKTTHLLYFYTVTRCHRGKDLEM